MPQVHLKMPLCHLRWSRVPLRTHQILRKTSTKWRAPSRKTRNLSLWTMEGLQKTRQKPWQRKGQKRRMTHLQVLQIRERHRDGSQLLLNPPCVTSWRKKISPGGRLNSQFKMPIVPRRSLPALPHPHVALVHATVKSVLNDPALAAELTANTLGKARSTHGGRATRGLLEEQDGELLPQHRLPCRGVLRRTGRHGVEMCLRSIKRNASKISQTGL